MVTKSLHSECVTVWCAISQEQIIRPYLFIYFEDDAGNTIVLCEQVEIFFFEIMLKVCCIEKKKKKKYIYIDINIFKNYACTDIQ